MNCIRTTLPLSLLALAVACVDPLPPDEGDGSTSTGDASSASAPSTTSSSTTGDPEQTSTSSGESSDGGSTEGQSTDTDADGSGTGSGSSSGEPVNDCTDEADPCVLDLDTTYSGLGGGDQFFVYVVGEGTERVLFDAIAGDYTAWDATSGTYFCNLMGPCCASEGALCEKPLVQEFLDIGPGDTAYFYVYATAPYELTIASE